jgi:putative phosphoesterase
MTASAGGACRLVVLADTHIRRGGIRRLPDAVYRALDGADAVLHAGDVLQPELLDELSGFAPVHAVLGNNDHELLGLVPVTTEFVIGGVRIAMIHDSGSTSGREGRMSRRFPDADVVVFGHSHAPLDALGVGGQRLFNPGSPTERRAQAHHTFGLLRVEDGEVGEHRIVPV